MTHTPRAGTLVVNLMQAAGIIILCIKGLKQWNRIEVSDELYSRGFWNREL